MLKVLDLFSGIGGFSLGLERTGGFETVAFCEIEDYPRKVLAKHWPDVPIYEDVKELTYERLEADGLGGIDIIVGGYPCQPFSQPGSDRGAEDDRHLWPEVKRLMATVRPTWGLFENVAGHISMGLDEVLSDLADEGYAAWTCVIPACAVDAPHRRDRVWILANSNGGRRDTQPLPSPQRDSRENNLNTDQSGKGSRTRVLANPGHTGVLQRRKHVDGGKVSDKQGRVRRNVLSGREQGKVLADASSGGLQGRSEARNNSSDRPKPRNEQFEGLRGVYEPRTSGQARWLSEPNVGRVAYGIPRRVDRLKALGNAVVPQIPEMIGYAILEAENA
jgi:DNA (cytosine-5)-methyltransferase 1